jgi:hypothetical protein
MGTNLVTLQPSIISNVNGNPIRRRVDSFEEQEWFRLNKEYRKLHPLEYNACSPLNVNRRFGGTNHLYVHNRRKAKKRNQLESR